MCGGAVVTLMCGVTVVARPVDDDPSSFTSCSVFRKHLRTRR